MVELYAIRPKGGNTPIGGAWIIEDGKTTVFLTYDDILSRYG
jgi:hypothetical protein